MGDGDCFFGTHEKTLLVARVRTPCARKPFKDNAAKRRSDANENRHRQHCPHRTRKIHHHGNLCIRTLPEVLRNQHQGRNRGRRWQRPIR